MLLHLCHSSSIELNQLLFDSNFAGEEKVCFIKHRVPPLLFMGLFSFHMNINSLFYV